MFNNKKLLTILTICTLGLSFFVTIAHAEGAQPTVTPTVEVNQTTTETVEETKLFIANVIDAAEVTDYTKTNLSNRQPVTLSVDVDTGSGVRTDKVETTISFAASPVSRATDILQSNPRGSNKGSVNFPIYPK